MTFWQFLTNVYNWAGDRASRILAILLGTVTTLTGTGLIPLKQLPYYAGAISLLNFWRGQVTAATVAQATAVIASIQPVKVAIPIASPVSTIPSFLIQSRPPESK